MDKNIDIENKIKGCLIGGAVGDALGYPIEFLRGIKNKVYTNYKNGNGIISDDTQMTLFTANAILAQETLQNFTNEKLSLVLACYYAYLDWLETQYNSIKSLKSLCWIKNTQELNKQRAPGNTCINALSQKIMGTLDNPINQSKGCGALMRVAPIGIYAKSPEMAGELAVKIGAITHGHIFSHMACYVFASLINLLIFTNENIEIAIKKSLDLMKIFFIKNKLAKSKYIKEFLKLINRAIKLSKKMESDVKSINMLGEGWVAEETLAISIYSCLKYKNNFTEAVVASVNHDGDSDSTGSVTGNIMGAYLGLSNIPQYFIDNLDIKSIIMEIANDLVLLVNKDESINNNNENWIRKYINCINSKYS